MFEAEPLRAVSLIDRDPDMQIDRLTSGLVEFPAGRQLVFVCSTQVVRYQKMHVFGTTGRIEIEIPVIPPADEATRIWMEQGNSGVAEAIEFEPCDQYYPAGGRSRPRVPRGNSCPLAHRGRYPQHACPGCAFGLPRLPRGKRSDA